jgi:hypothetical protein
MGSKLTVVAILVVTLGLLGGSGYYLYEYFAHQPKKIITYQDIILGDSKDQVFYALGKPSRVLIPNKDETAPEVILGKETLEKNPDHEKAYHHWQYLTGQTVTDVLFDPETKKSINVGCSKLSAQPKFVPEPPPEIPIAAKGKKNALAAPVPVTRPGGPPLTPAEAAEAPATEPPAPAPAPAASPAPGAEPPAPSDSPSANGDAPADGATAESNAESCTINGVKIGDPEKEVLKLLGRPKKETYNGTYKTIFYPNFNLAIKMEKRVVTYIMAIKEVLPKPVPIEEGKEDSEMKEDKAAKEGKKKKEGKN